MTPSDVLTRMLHSIDALDWETLRDSFAPEVRTDYTSLWGGEPATIKVDDLLDQWRAMMFGLAATHHQTGPVRVDDDGTGHTHVSAHHWLEGGEVWVVHGHYAFRLDGDRISELTLLVHRQEGDRSVPDKARERAASNPVRGSAGSGSGRVAAGPHDTVVEEPAWPRSRSSPHRASWSAPTGPGRARTR